MTMVEMLLEMGGRRWTTATHDRVYIPTDVACRVIGLRVTRYGSGNVSSATLRGERVSNSSATDMLASLRDAYYDVKTDKFRSAYGVADALRERLAATVTA